MGKARPDGGILHAADPEPGNGLRAAALLIHQPEDQLALPARRRWRRRDWSTSGPVPSGLRRTSNCFLSATATPGTATSRAGWAGRRVAQLLQACGSYAAGRSQLHQVAHAPAHEAAAAPSRYPSRRVVTPRTFELWPAERPKAFSVTIRLGKVSSSFLLLKIKTALQI